MYIHVVEPSKPKPKRGPKTGGGRVLTPGELSFDRWHKLKKPLVKDNPTFTRFQDPQERQKLKLDEKKQLSNLGASFLMLPAK